MSRRSELLQRNIKAMLDAGVRRTTFYPLVSESLEQTRDRPRQIRRALAFAHLLDTVDQVVLPHELLAGSITGMWPLAEPQPTLEQHLSEGRRVLREYRERRRLDSPATPVGRSALMARDHYDSRIRFSDLQQVAGHARPRAGRQRRAALRRALPGPGKPFRVRLWRAGGKEPLRAALVRRESSLPRIPQGPGVRPERVATGRSSPAERRRAPRRGSSSTTRR